MKKIYGEFHVTKEQQKYTHEKNRSTNRFFNLRQ